jgi:hypothetical protein
MTTLDNSANEFAAFSTILSGFDDEISPSRFSNNSTNGYKSQSSPTTQSINRANKNEQRFSKRYDPDDTLDCLQEMNDMLLKAENERSPERVVKKNTFEDFDFSKKSSSRATMNDADDGKMYRQFEDSAERIARDQITRENEMKQTAKLELKRQLDRDDYSIDTFDDVDRKTILAREAEILRREEESVRRVRERTDIEIDKQRMRVDMERQAYANARTNYVSAENKRRGSHVNKSQGDMKQQQQLQQAATRVVPQYESPSAGKENVDVVQQNKKKSSSSFFNPFKSITNVAKGAKNALLSRENPKQKPKVRRSIIATDEPDENEIQQVSYKTPVRESTMMKRATILTPVEDEEKVEAAAAASAASAEKNVERYEDEVLIAKMVSPGQMVYIRKPIERAAVAQKDQQKTTTTTTTRTTTKKKNNNKRTFLPIDVHPGVMRVAKAASTIGASFVVVSAIGSYATGARDIRDLQRAANRLKKVTVGFAMFLGKTWKSVSKNLMPGVIDEVPTLTPTLVYQRTPNNIVKKTVVLRPHQVGVQPGPSGEDFRRAYGRG